MSRGVVLVTGINGYLGTYTALAFLDAGYTVRGTARTAAKALDWVDHFPAHKAAYQHAIAADFGVPGAFDDAVKGCDIVVHVASPNTLHLTDNETDMLIPAIRGTRILLDSVKTKPRVRRVVFTGTMAALLDTSNVEPGRVYTANDWNPGTYDAAKVSPNPRFVYGVSKALAERAFWDYIKEEQPSWAGTTILPSAVFDPAIQPLRSLADLNRSIAFLWDVASGKHKAGLALSIARRNYSPRATSRSRTCVRRSARRPRASGICSTRAASLSRSSSTLLRATSPTSRRTSPPRRRRRQSLWSSTRRRCARSWGWSVVSSRRSSLIQSEGFWS
ncbi:NAD-P-binding protein [Mycena polygramma]|nr:NAD-P-binding protein [Mycena polygramma]